MLETFKQAGGDGLSCDEFEEKTGIPHTSASAMMRSLKDEGALVKLMVDGKHVTAVTRAGRRTGKMTEAGVWVWVSPARRKPLTVADNPHLLVAEKILKLVDRHGWIPKDPVSAIMKITRNDLHEKRAPLS